MKKAGFSSFLAGFLGTFLLAGGLILGIQNALGSSDENCLDCIDDFNYSISYQTDRMTIYHAELKQSAINEGWTVKEIGGGNFGSGTFKDEFSVVLEKE